MAQFSKEAGCKKTETSKSQKIARELNFYFTERHHMSADMAYLGASSHALEWQP